MNFLNAFYAYLCNAEPELPGGGGKPPKSAMDTLTSDELGEYAEKAKAAYTSGNNPASWVGDEELWEKAKEHIGKGVDESEEKYWPEVVAHYKELGGTILSNENPDLTELECAFDNEAREDKDGFVQLASFGDKENVTPDGLRVIQRFGKSHALMLKNEFDSTQKDEAEAFSGIPIYKGHPDRDGTIPRGNAGRKIGRTMQLQVREDGLYGTRLMNSRGQNLVKSGAARYPSVNWFAKATGVEGQKLVMEPVQLISWGLTPKPNLPVKPLVNSAIVEKFLKNADPDQVTLDTIRNNVFSAIAADSRFKTGASNAAGGAVSGTWWIRDIIMPTTEGGYNWFAVATKPDDQKLYKIPFTLSADKQTVTLSDGEPMETHVLYNAWYGDPEGHAEAARKGGGGGEKRGMEESEYEKWNAREKQKHVHIRDAIAERNHTKARQLFDKLDTAGKDEYFESLPKRFHSHHAKILGVEVRSFSNSESNTGGTPATNQEGAKMDKTKLIALLATVGVTLANDASEDAIEKAMQDAFGKVKTAEEISIALANAKTDAENKAKEIKTATDKVTELTANLANAQTEITAGNEAKTKLAATEKEVTDLKGKLQVAETTLANSREERSKTAAEAAKIATDLTEANTKLGLTTTTLTNERKEHEKTTGALKNAKAAIIDLSVAFGKIRPHQRKDLEAALANDVEFAGVCDKLKKADPVFKMVPILTNESLKSQNAEPAEQYRVLVNETMKKDNISYEKATVKVKSSEKGKALLALMKQPETGIPVVR